MITPFVRSLSGVLVYSPIARLTTRRLQSFIRLTDIAIQIATCVLEQFGAGCVEFVENLILRPAGGETRQNA